MKKFAILFAGLFLMTFAFQSVNAQNPQSIAAADASATIISPISITKVNGMDLKFGNIIADPSNTGTVMIATDGTPSYSTVAPPSITGDRAQAQFMVEGEDGVAYNISLPASAEISIGGGGAGTPMTIDAFVSDPSGTSTIDAGGSELNVGATLNVGVAQPVGLYTGSFNVTVAYN